MSDTCRKCRYFFGPPQQQWGKCRRRAPVILQGLGHSSWPEVHVNDSCGEYEFLSVEQALCDAENAEGTV